MLEYSVREGLNQLDKAILRVLQQNSRISNVELARQINLSPPATHARVKRLEEQGVIRQYTTLIDPEAVGYDMLCFVHINLQVHQFEQVERFREVVQQMPEVLECHHLTGEYDYLLKVVIRSRRDLERFVVNQLTPIPGVARIPTSLVLTEVKVTTMLPLE